MKKIDTINGYSCFWVQRIPIAKESKFDDIFDTSLSRKYLRFFKFMFFYKNNYYEITKKVLTPNFMAVILPELFPSKDSVHEFY